MNAPILGQTRLGRAPMLVRGCGVLALLCCIARADAQIVLGQTAAFTGPPAGAVKEITEGAKLYFDHVNASGGVNGQKIVLESMDDAFEPKRTVENAEKLITEKKVVALFLNRATPNTEALFPVLAKHRIALVAPSTGAMSLHQPVNPFIFNVRSTYQEEAERAVELLATLGTTRIAVLHVDDSFGRDGLVGAQKGFTKAKLEAATIQKYDRQKWNFDTVVPAIKQSNAQAVLTVAVGQALVDFVKQLRAAKSTAQVVTLSNNASGAFVKSLGEHGPGVIVTQVFPGERNSGVAFVREARSLASAKGLPGVTPAMLEGFAGAKVMVEALRRAGKNATRESVIAALNGMKSYDLGGLEIGYSATDHTGLDFVELSIIGQDGTFQR